MSKHDAGDSRAVMLHKLAYRVGEILRIIEGKEELREGLVETPVRVAKAMVDEWFGGYVKNPEAVLKVFEDGGERYDEMVIETNIPVHSHCEHHMAPFSGVAHVAYIPRKRIVGLSKLARLTDIFARRLQVQERLTTQIADTIQKVLKPLGVGVVIQCEHSCMCSRGVKTSGTETITSCLHGRMRKPEVRQEFLSLIALACRK